MSQAAHHQDQKQRSEQQQHELDVDARYETCGPIEAGSGSEVVDPWLQMQYPLEELGAGEDGVIETAVNFRAEQHDDGSGILMSHAGGAVYALRMADGTVVGNESRGMMWPWGSEMEGEVDYVELPYEFVGAVLQEQTDIHTPGEGSVLDLGTRDGENTVEGRVWMRGAVDVDILPDDHEESGALITHDSGVQIYVGWDSTSHTERQNDLFGFVPFDGEGGVPVPSASDALDLLKPHDAVAREEVTRQGEWFLVDVDEEPEGSLQKPGVSSRPFGGSPLESHVPRDWATGVDDETFLERVEAHEEVDQEFDTPQEVFDWVQDHVIPDVTEWTVEHVEQMDHGPGDLSHLFDELRELADGIYVRGSFRHRDNEHYVENAGDEWHKATTHDWEVMTTDSVTGSVMVD